MLDLGHFICVYDGVLDEATCAAIIETFEGAPEQHYATGRKYRNGRQEARARWAEMEIGACPAMKPFEAMLAERAHEFAARYEKDTDHSLVPFELEAIKMKRYDPVATSLFPPHIDITYTGTMHRMLAVLWYLNDVADGGHTWFGKLDVRIPPRAGRLLMFPPTFMYPHAGMPPKSGPKYIVGTYLSYKSLEESVRAAETAAG